MSEYQDDEFLTIDQPLANGKADFCKKDQRGEARTVRWPGIAAEPLHYAGVLQEAEFPHAQGSPPGTQRQPAPHSVNGAGAQSRRADAGRSAPVPEGSYPHRLRVSVAQAGLCDADHRLEARRGDGRTRPRRRPWAHARR
jgi:hypothetical protein